ncbi:hypothetical protein [Paraburkholderia saeva]|uniref:hypothetical protein n=1 Tax=Paraburkholderia saeva TaxID=2777537 RepID=UPI001DE181EF|nr:hypothetical protein [Paraburkholderia saeva]CAG4916201.1 hypothetical protein R52603_04425 [Paraburkholderia saeva]
MSPERRFDIACCDFEVPSKRPHVDPELNIELTIVKIVEVLLICVAWLRVTAPRRLSGYALRTKFRVFSQTSISVDDVAMRRAQCA